MIGSAAGTTVRHGVVLRAGWGVLSADGMAVAMVSAARGEGDGPRGGPYRSRPELAGGRAFHVVETAASTVAVVSARRLGGTSRQQVSATLLRRHAVVAYLEDEAPGSAVLSCRSDALDENAAVMEAAIAACAYAVIGGWDESPVLTFVVQPESRVPGRPGQTQSITATASYDGERWSVRAARTDGDAGRGG